MDDLTGSRLGDYRLMRLLGRGAMAAVYLAEQQSLGRRVAVKVLNADLARDAAYVARFQQEARSAASMVDAHIVQVYEVGVAGDQHYLAQEYVPGGTLGQLVAKQGPLGPGQVLGVLCQVAMALAAAAERGLVHRDIKPDNLMLDRSGAVKVADFGLARVVGPAASRLTQVGVTMGTPLYMSPEQVEGRELDSRSDLYSLGVTAYHLLTGDPPFVADTPLAVAIKHLQEAPEPIASRRPGLPASLADVVDRLIAKSPDARYASPRELLDTLRRVAKRGAEEGWNDDETIAASAAIAGLGEALPAASDPAGGSTGAGAADRLGRAMRGQTDLLKTFGKGRLGWAAAILASGVVASAAGFALRPARLVPRVGATMPQRAESVVEQLFRAKLVDTPEAWRSVQRFFPDEDAYYHLLAMRGLAECCFARGAWGDAIPALQKLSAREATEPELGGYGNAGLVVAYERLGRADAARQALDHFTSAPLDPRAMAEELRRLFPASLESLGIDATAARR
ncbi:MAG: serine/threonine-protein kinase [Lacipirellulaceae bacterium]